MTLLNNFFLHKFVNKQKFLKLLQLEFWLKKFAQKLPVVSSLLLSINISHYSSVWWEKKEIKEIKYADFYFYFFCLCGLKDIVFFGIKRALQTINFDLLLQMPLLFGGSMCVKWLVHGHNGGILLGVRFSDHSSGVKTM